MNDYKNNIQTILREHANKQKDSENEVNLNSLKNLDTSSIQMEGISYNLDLNSMGHEYDGMIKTGVIAAAVVGAVAVVAASGGTAAAAAGAMVDNVIDVADTVSDVGSIISNQKAVGRIERAAGFVANAADQYNNFNNYNQQMGQQMGSNKGLIDSMIGFVTERTMSKPQRSKAIRNYIESSLAPEFKMQLNNISKNLINSIRNTLQNEASVLIGQKTNSLNQLKSEMKEKKALFDQRMEQLREYKTLLLTL